MDKIVDLTGAGDLYAAGFLYGLSRGFPHEVCGRLGSLAAAEVISHVGARPVEFAQAARRPGGSCGLSFPTSFQGWPSQPLAVEEVARLPEERDTPLGDAREG